MRRRPGSVLAPEHLEPRRFLADSAAALAFTAEVADADSDVAMIRWQGQDYFAFRDSYVLRMPQTNAATSAGLWDYASDEPAVEPGWSLRSLGAGFFEVTTPGATVADVSAWSLQSGVLFISPNEALEKQALDPQKFPSPPDPKFQQYQWGLHNTGTPTGTQPPEGPLFPRKADADIDAPEAWNMDGQTYTGSKAIIVAVLDDGIDWRHPDLAENMWNRDNAIDITTGNRVTIPNTVTGVFGWDSAENDPDVPGQGLYSITPNPKNLLTNEAINDSHGTHVAGIIGAKAQNGKGIAGVNWDVGLYSAKIFKDGGKWGGSAAFIDAVNRIVTLRTQYRQAIVAANASFYTYSATTGLAMLAGVQRLNEAGIVLVAAAGNGYDKCREDGVGDKNDADTPYCWDLPVYPANLVGSTAKAPVDNVISVASSTARDTLSRFSNWGPATVDIAAPGENIWSTVCTVAAERVPNSAVFSTYATHEPFEDGNPGGQPERRMAYRTVPQPLVTYKNPVTGQIDQAGGYASMSGTSMSAAYVSGTIALASYFYNFVTGSLPSVAFLRSAILEGADTVATLTYTEKFGTPGMTDPDYHQDLQNNAREGMFHQPSIDDPAEPRVHRIAGDRRLNAFGTMKWCRDNLPPSVVITDARRLEGDVGTTQATFTARLLDIKNLAVAANAKVTVLYWTEDIAGGAQGGVDYVAIPSASPKSFAIPAGQTQATFTVDILGDTIAEPDESFRVRFRMSIDSTDYWARDYWARTKAAACTIVDDDPSDAKPLVRFIVGGTGNPVTREVSEPSTGMMTILIGVELDRVAKKAVAVPYEIKTPGFVPSMQASDMADLAKSYEPSPLPGWTQAMALAEYQKFAAAPSLDYVAQRGSVTIAAGQRSASIPVRILADGLVEPREYLSLRLLPPNLGVLKDASRVKVIAISDPPGPPVISQLIAPAPVTEGADAVFRLELLAPLPAGTSLAIFFTVLDGTARSGFDYVQPTVLKAVIPAGQSAAEIRVRTIRDALVEPVGETFVLRVWKAVYTRGNGTSLDLKISPISATASIRDPVPGQLKAGL